MLQSDAQPRVGVGVIVLRDGRVLLGLRKGSHGAGTWALPGGHLEFGETLEACARRELLQETGLALRPLELVQAGPLEPLVPLVPVANDVMHAECKHYVTLFVVATASTGEPALLEPDKCERWAWFDWSALPQPLFQPLQTLLASGWVPVSAQDCSISRSGSVRTASIQTGQPTTTSLICSTGDKSV